MKDEDIIGISTTNYQQKFLIDALCDDTSKIVFAIGIAGTGKTLLSIAAGLTQVLNKKYNKIIVSRSPIPMGRDIGYLPGNINDKLDPWLKPIYDNIEFIFKNLQSYHKNTEQSNKTGNTKNKVKKNKDLDNEKYYNYPSITVDYLKEMNMIEIEGLTYIRGRTFHNSFIIIDEAQNLTPHEVKTIITRIGKDSKIVLTGDIQQIDNPYVDEKDNGLAYASERFNKLGQSISATIYMNKCERSELSGLAAQIL